MSELLRLFPGQRSLEFLFRGSFIQSVINEWFHFYDI